MLSRINLVFLALVFNSFSPHSIYGSYKETEEQQKESNWTEKIIIAGAIGLGAYSIYKLAQSDAQKTHSEYLAATCTYMDKTIERLYGSAIKHIDRCDTNNIAENDLSILSAFTKKDYSTYISRLEYDIQVLKAYKKALQDRTHTFVIDQDYDQAQAVHKLMIKAIHDIENVIPSLEKLLTVLQLHKPYFKAYELLHEFRYKCVAKNYAYIGSYYETMRTYEKKLNDILFRLRWHAIAYPRIIQKICQAHQYACNASNNARRSSEYSLLTPVVQVKATLPIITSSAPIPVSDHYVHTASAIAWRKRAEQLQGEAAFLRKLADQKQRALNARK
jgi:hypothetical protein